MDRRQFLGGVTAASVSTISGCGGTADPEMEAVRTVRPDPRVVSADATDTEYVGEIHNRGSEGTVRAELWFFQNASVPNPEESHLFETDTRADRTFDVAQSSFFSGDERRDVSITADQPPEEWTNRRYGIFPVPGSYGAVFENHGDSGEVELNLEFETTETYDVEAPASKVKSVSSGEEIEVLFETVIPGGVEYEITAEPA